MVKDDYDVVVFRILVYLYAIFKGKQVFDRHIFLNVISKIWQIYIYLYKRCFTNCITVVHKKDDKLITSARCFLV